MLLYGSFLLSWFHKGQFVAFWLVLYQFEPYQGHFKAISGCFEAILVCTEVVSCCCEPFQGCFGSFMGCFGMLQGLPKLFLSVLGRFEVVLFHFKVISKLLRSFQGLFELFQFFLVWFGALVVVLSGFGVFSAVSEHSEIVSGGYVSFAGYLWYSSLSRSVFLQ
jgi:hypothetical protein